MTIRTLGVPCYGSMDLEALLTPAVNLARPLGAHIELTYVLPDALAELAMFPSSAIAAGLLPIDRMVEEVKQEAQRQHQRFEAWCRDNDLGHEPVAHRLDSVFARWTEEEGPLETIVMRHGRLADLTLVRLPEPGDVLSSRCFDAAVVATGRPVVVVPRTCPSDFLRHVVIAWDGSLEAAHAVAMSLPVLRAAARVSIFTARHPHDTGSPERELAASLHWHGIAATVVERPVDGHPVGEVMLDLIREREASMLVMGAFTHSRIRETLIGGVTRHVLRHSPVPVLMAH